MARTPAPQKPTPVPTAPVLTPQARLKAERNLAVAARHSASPFTPDHTYFADAEPHMVNLWTTVVQPFIGPGRRFGTVLDLACGHGRNSAVLRTIAERLVLVDIQPGNIEVCRRRFRTEGNFEYIVNNGYDLAAIPDASIDLLYCFDAMVHFDSDVVRAYLVEARRVLQPAGIAFLHHSNYTNGEDWLVAPSNRNFCSKDLMAHYARKEGLRILKQHVMGWGGTPDLDCLSLLAQT